MCEDYTVYTTVGTLLIAVISLFVSLFILLRDRRERQIDMLYQSYQRFHKIYSSKQHISDSDLEKMKEDPKDAKFVESKRNMEDIQEDLERELEFACYLMTKNKSILKYFSTCSEACYHRVKYFGKIRKTIG
jgi:hypothetical protein